MSINQIKDPYYLDPSIINSDSYFLSLNDVFLPILPGLTPDVIIQHEEAHSHTE